MFPDSESLYILNFTDSIPMGSPRDDFATSFTGAFTHIRQVGSLSGLIGGSIFAISNFIHGWDASCVTNVAVHVAHAP